MTSTRDFSFVKLTSNPANGHAWTAYVTANITTIGKIEQITGMNFLPNLSATKRAALENFKAPALWPKE